LKQLKDIILLDGIFYKRQVLQLSWLIL